MFRGPIVEGLRLPAPYRLRLLFLVPEFIRTKKRKKRTLSVLQWIVLSRKASSVVIQLLSIVWLRAPMV